jgi:SnoaL-like domain
MMAVAAVSTRTILEPGSSVGISATLAAYAQAWDDGRIEDVVSLFTPDGSIDLPGVGVTTGTEALRELYRSMLAPGASRHVFVNTHITSSTADQARAVSDLLVLGGQPWQIQAVGRYIDTFRRSEGTWRFHTRTLRLAE